MKKIILGMAACAALCACTSDDLVDNSTSNSELTNGVYMKFKIELPSTRSTTTSTDADDYVTSSEGIEYGQDYENTVSNVLILLATEDGEPIAFAKEYSGTGDTYYVATFEASDIESYADQEVNIVVLCNTSVTGDSYDVDGTYTLTDATDGTPWKDNQFYMSNAEVSTTVLPDDFSPYKDINTPYNIGTVKVERSCARFDYKDGSTGDYTYPMMVDEENAQINLVMEEVALINLSNSFYYLRRTATDIEGVAEYTNTTLFGVEKVNNWVIDTDAAAKMNYNGEDLSSNFIYPLQSPNTWKWTSMSDIENADNDDSWNNENTYGDYNIWCYATENTIPSVEQQKHGITTGIVFKCLMEPTNDCDKNLVEVIETGTDRIFVFANEVVGTWGMVEEYAKTYPLTALAAAYRNVLGDMNLDESLTLSEAQAKEGFTGYSPDNDGKYYVYYYYWNRHNDNNSNADMGIMEFAVVRNNVYKLSVTGISLFGHPAPYDPDDPDPDPDPDPVTPDDNDEEDNIYIQVEVEVLPWVVRVNDITF